MSSGLGVLAFAVLLGAPGLARAQADWIVNSEDDVDDLVCDATHCSLREALNAALVDDTIGFSFTGPSAARTIEIEDALPAPLQGVTIDGFDCTGCGTVAANTALPSAGFDGSLGLTITLSATASVGTITEVLLASSNEVVLRGLNVRGSPDVGIRIQGDEVVVEGCYVGTALDGSLTTDVNAGVGIAVEGADDVEIGPYNIISGNGSHGIEVSGEDSDDLSVFGNLIGTDATAAAAVGNTAAGVRLLGGGNGLNNPGIGGSDSEDANVISGNAGGGLLIEHRVLGGAVEGNLIGVVGPRDPALGHAGPRVYLLGSGPADTQPDGIDFVDNVVSANGGAGIHAEAAEDCDFFGNAIGTDATGALDLGNYAEGIHFFGGTAHESKDHEVGDSDAANANTIAYNGTDGIRMWVTADKKVKDNRIGINSIHDNTESGIDLMAASTGDGPGDPAPGTCGNDNSYGNRGIGAPVVTDALYQGGTLTVTGTSCDEAAIDVYLADGDASGYGEPLTWLGSTTADTSGDWSVALVVSGLSDADPITALQTDGDDETSEPAANFALFSCDADEDGDDSDVALCGGDDCDDTDPDIYLGAPELCDTIDSDCDLDLVDEFIDTDSDGDPDCTDPDNDGDGDPDATD